MEDHLSDMDLLRQFRVTNSRNYAFNLLVRKYQQPLYWQIRRMVISHDDANDLVQEVFVRAWKGLPNFREDAKLSTWLYRIAVNQSISFLNNKKKRFFLPLVDVQKELSERIDNDPLISEDDISRKLQKAILTLPEKQRLVFNMKYFDDMKYEDMSEILDTSVGALKASYHHATRKIEKYLNEN